MTLSPVLKHKAVLLLALMLGLVVLLAPSYAHAGWFSWVTGVIDIPDLLGKFFYLIATTLGGAVLYLGSLLLDYSVFYLVVQMGTFFQSGAQFGQAVALGWTLIRDLINMTFIFGLIYIGIKTILNSEDADTRRKLGYLIIAALLINFSLFMTQLVVDFSNLLATQMYSQLSQPGPANSVPSISGAFMNASKVSSYINTQTIQQGETAKPAISGSALIVYSVMLLIFYVFAGISFLMGSFLIVSRFVALILYMIFSPVMFLGWILPQFKSYSSTWWEGFWKNCIFAPVYLFILYISLQILRGLTTTGSVLATSANSGSLDMVGKATQAAQTSIGQIVISFMIMIGLLWASQKIGEKLSISGGKMTMSGFKSVGLGAAGMASGLAYRTFLGRPLDRVRKGYDRLDSVAEDSSRGRMARLGAKTLRGIAGGEAGRRSVIKARDYSAGGTGWTEKEKSNDERSARAAKGLRESSKAAELKGGNALSLLDHEAVAYAQDSSKAQLIVDAAQKGNLSASALKAITSNKDVDPALVDKIKAANKVGLSEKLKSDDGVKAVLKQVGNDPKAFAGILNGLSKAELVGNKAITDVLSQQPNLVKQLGSHMSDDDGKAKRLKQVLKNKNPDLGRILDNDRFWS